MQITYVYKLLGEYTLVRNLTNELYSIEAYFGPVSMSSNGSTGEPYWHEVRCKGAAGIVPMDHSSLTLEAVIIEHSSAFEASR
jgi:hypothetical protein